MGNLENDIPKYKKKKKSTTSKSREKSNHKHEYTEKCVVKYPTPYLVGKEFSYGLVTYCKHCGKVASLTHPTKEEHVNTGIANAFMSVFMTNEEILEYYKDLDVVEVEDMFPKYVSITKSK